MGFIHLRNSEELKRYLEQKSREGYDIFVFPLNDETYTLLYLLVSYVFINDRKQDLSFLTNFNKLILLVKKSERNMKLLQFAFPTCNVFFETAYASRYSKYAERLAEARNMVEAETVAQDLVEELKNFIEEKEGAKLPPVKVMLATEEEWKQYFKENKKGFTFTKGDVVNGEIVWSESSFVGIFILDSVSPALTLANMAKATTLLYYRLIKKERDLYGVLEEFFEIEVPPVFKGEETIEAGEWREV